MSLRELPLPSIASLRAIAALKSPHLALVRPARIGLGFELGSVKQKTLLEVEETLGGPGRLSLPYSLRWLLDAMTGLGVLHRTLGFVHGEVQPEHLVLGEDGVGRLIPVVRAHWVRGEQRAPERLYYLAPEKLLGDRVDVRSDVFSLGVMLWEALQGQRLLEAYEVDDIIARFMGGGIPRPVAPEGETWTLPLAAVAERAIAVDPGRRFGSVAEMKEAIEGASHRYLASTPGMVELYQDPERRLRGVARDSLAPDSQRATLPPMQAQRPSLEANTPVNAAALEAAAERLSRSSFFDLEEELTTKPNAASRPSAEHLPVARPHRHVNTLLGVPPPAVERDSSPDSVTMPNSRNPASVAPTLLVPVGALLNEARASQHPPQPSPQKPASARSQTPAPLVAPVAQPLSQRPAAQPLSQRPVAASLSPLARPPEPLAAEPSFELVRPRKRRGALWLLLGAAAAIGLFAARPWIAAQMAGATGAMPDRLAPNVEKAVELPPSPPPRATDAPSASAAESPRVGIASTPPTPSERAPARSRGGSADEHVVIHDSVDAQYPQPTHPAAEPKPEPKHEPKPEAKPEPKVEPPPAPTPTSAPKPKAAPVSDADRYGI